ncbi:ABC transporter substrate-binding protein [Roseivivax marinus]|uniref:ABC transporter substrate-binding protein n=1 Tax=Roseivivax marinus TaxID=1379903 RepID=UPI001F0414C5|nr:ABC transporter substrate-binding protein [Roseivivax marinus]UMA65737.1 ABC transporter substrate-binding protein [Roseivivax marinus]
MTRAVALALGLGAAVLSGGAFAEGAPQRVVSLNVCTDQLAWLLAPDALVAVSTLAHDPATSAYAAEMADVPVTPGAAEAVVLRKPDLVLAGTYTTRATVTMLERLGYRVETFAPVNSLDEAVANMRRMGEVLGQEERAARMIDAFESRRARLTRDAESGPRTLLYHAQGRSSGAGSMADDLLRAAGMRNVATELGLPPGGRLPLEAAVLADPDLIVVGTPYEGFAWATEMVRHPALAATGALRDVRDGADWSCETPKLLDALERLVTLADEAGT